MAISDRTEIYSAPPVTVRVHRGEAKQTRSRFSYNFRLGRGEECDIRFTDPRVSSNHAGGVLGKWPVVDPGP